MKKPALIFATSLVLLSSCDRKDPDGSSGAAPKPGAGLAGQPKGDLAEPLAKIGEYTITVGEFQDQINRQSPYVRPRYTSLEQKRDFLDNMVRFEVLAREAAKRGFDKDPEVIRTMKQVMIQKLMKEEFEQKLSPDDIPEADLKKYYEAHAEEYNRAEEVRVAAIIFKSEGRAGKVAPLALGAEGKTNKGFRELVAAHSEDEKTKQRGGDLRYFEVGSTEHPEAVVKAAFELKKTGDVAGPIDGKNGLFYIIKQTGKRKGVAKSFESVKRQVRNRVYREKRTQEHKAFIARLRKEAKVEVKEENFAKVRIDTSKPRGKDGKPLNFERDGHGHDEH